MQKTLGAIACLALIVFYRDELAALLIYDRDAILSGQLWRLCSSALVHLSVSHLAINATAIVLIAAIGKQETAAATLTLCLLVSLLSSLFVLVYRPEIRYFGGLSGIATALFVYTVIAAMQRRAALRLLGAAALVALLIKTAVELLYDRSVSQALVDGQPFSTITASHVIGIAVALGLWLAQRAGVFTATGTEALTLSPPGRGGDVR